MGGAQTKIQHLSSQRSNKAQKSGAFTIIQHRKASRSRLLTQVVRTSSSLFFQLFKFLTPLAGSLVVLKAVALIELSCFLLWDILTSFSHTEVSHCRSYTESYQYAYTALTHKCMHTVSHTSRRAHTHKYKLNLTTIYRKSADQSHSTGYRAKTFLEAAL